jgi:hypothetical protein
MRTRVILLERLVWMLVEMLYNMRPQDLIDVAGSCYTVSSAWTKILEDNGTKFRIQANTTPHHDARSAPWISFHNTVVIVTFTLPSPNSCSTISCGNAISAFIEEDDIPPLSITPVLPL